MKHQKILAAMLISGVLLGCNKQPSDINLSETKHKINQSNKTKIPTDTLNPLLVQWSGPYQGVPAFDKVKVSQLKPAIEIAMSEKLAEIDEIANNPDAPTFENTIVAMERTGETLDRIFTYWGIWSSNMSTPEFRTLQAEMAPKLSAFTSKINQNQKLFNRIKAVYEGKEMKALRADQQRLVYLT